MVGKDRIVTLLFRRKFLRLASQADPHFYTRKDLSKVAVKNCLIVWKDYRLPVLLIITLLFGSLGAYAQSVPPSIFFTDITSGPNSGGESVSGFSGAYVTVYGNNFGTTQGTSTITWNGQNCLRVVSWGTTWLWYQKTVVQLGSSCVPGTGNFVVTVNNVASSVATENFNRGTLAPSRFTVRSNGNIYCVSTSGNDNNSGKFPSCWQTIVKGRQIAAGDITYVQNGVSQTATDGFAALTPNGSGTSWDNALALVAYPGATATIGSGSTDGIMFCAGFSACNNGSSYWTIAGFVLRGANSALVVAGFNGVTNSRWVGNDISCPTGDGSTACVTSNYGAFTYMYGNHVHNAGFTNSIKTYHAVYLSSNVIHNTVSWNSVHDVLGCRGIQFYSTGGSAQYDIHVHDNLIYNIRCDGINFATVNADLGVVEAYNNVIYNAGSGPDPSDGQAAYNCVLNGNSGTAPVLFYNNTTYNCGARKLAGSSGNVGFVPGGTNIKLNNNIFDQTSGEAYTSNAPCSAISGSNNLWFGVGAPPCTLSKDLNVDPLLRNVAGANFTLASSTSPPNGAGVAISGLGLDFDGLLRSSSPAIGAYEFTSASIGALPAPPTNLTVVVQ